jgi:hypothetical protein
MSGNNKKGFGIGEIVVVFLTSIVGLSLSPTIVSLTGTATTGMPSGATKSLLELFPLFWVMVITAIPVGSIALFLYEKVKEKEMSISSVIAIFLPSVVGLSLTPTVQSTVNTTANAMAVGSAQRTLIELFPMFWSIYLIGIPVSAIAVYFYIKTQDR